MESFVVLVRYQPFQFYSVCSAAMAKRSQHNSGEERVTAKSRQIMNLIARTPGKRFCGSQDPWSSIAKEEERSGRPDIITMNNLWKASLQQATQSGMTTMLGLLKSGKTDIETYELSGRPDETSWRATREVQTWFLSRGNPSRRNRAVRYERGNTS